jgi:hypothetical protein
MKRLLIPFLLLTAVTGYMSCQKEHSSDPASVNAAKTEGIKKGEPVSFSIENTSGLAAKWSVSPSSNVILTSDGDKATVYFRRSGSYSVMAATGGTIQRIMVNVTDSSFCDSLRRDSICGFPTDTIPTIPKDTTRPDTTCKNCGPHDSTYSLLYDHINITPIRIDTGGVSGLVIKATTRNVYFCPFNTLLTAFSSTNGSYYVAYTGVFVPGGCTGVQVQATSARVAYPVTDGTHTLKVNVSGVIYTGSFTKTGTQYSFNWSDTSKVTISPLIIN